MTYRIIKLHFPAPDISFASKLFIAACPSFICDGKQISDIIILFFLVIFGCKDIIVFMRFFFV